ncbi:MAG: S8 family serine peptidase [Candidatus Saccharibacteria bacterium]
MKFKKAAILSFLAISIVVMTAFIFMISNPPKNKNAIVENSPSNKNTYNPDKPNPDAPQAAKDSAIITIENESDRILVAQANNIGADEIKNIAGSTSYKINIPKSDIIIPASSSGSIKTQDNIIYRALATPNDPLFSSQWDLNKISAPSAWDLSKSSSSTKVAVIDTGFALNHQDLSGKFDIANAYDFINNDNSPMAGDTGAFVYHGTMVAGLAGASTNNGTGVASVGWNAKILPIQALDDEGNGSTFTVATAINYAVSKGVKIINLSLGSFSADPTMESAINDAIANGVSVIAASGNSGCDCIVYPANYSNVIAVGATDINDTRASFSNYGDNLDLVAPGAGTIRTTFMSATNKTSLYTTSANGTSIATPIVSGAVALLLDKNPTLTPAQVEVIMRSSADKVSGMSGQNFTKEYGYGRLNAQKPLAGTYTWEYVGQSASGNLVAGQKTTWTLSAKNTGTATWTNSGANPVRLGTDRSRDRSSNFCTATWLNCARPAQLNEANVTTGGIGTFTFEVQAPTSPGNYKEYFNLVAEGSTWMNELGQFFNPSVAAGNLSSSVVSNNMPTTIAAGGTANVTIVMKNTGNTYWYNSGKYSVNLGTSAPQDRSSQFSTSTWLGANRPAKMTESVVAPGQNATFSFSIKAPLAVNIYSESFSLVAEGWSWFGQSTSTSINVGGATPPPVIVTPNYLSLNQALSINSSIVSPNGQYRLIMQGDGNLVLYSPNRATWWTSTQNTGANIFIVQGDSNMVVYSPVRYVWASFTQNRGGKTLYMQDDGNLVLYDASSRAIWNSGTAGRI